ncbi:hypothetical protein VPHD51_0199 [Vibrio phage D51]
MVYCNGLQHGVRTSRRLAIQTFSHPDVQMSVQRSVTVYRIPLRKARSAPGGMCESYVRNLRGYVRKLCAKPIVGVNYMCESNESTGNY